MAIEFLRTVVISRKNSVRRMPAHLAYRACIKVYDEAQKKHFDYSKKQSVITSFLINAGGNNIEQLGNKMEAAEIRKDARVAREFILALPHELDITINKKICESFVDILVQKFGVAGHVAIHKADELRQHEKHRSADSLKNIHAHITISERKMGEDGNFVGDKIREINKKEFLEDLKKETRLLINGFLEEAGLDPMEKRDENKIATEHLGPLMTRYERRGEETFKGKKNREVHKINELYGAQKGIHEELGLLKKGLTKKNKVICSLEYFKYNENDPVILLSKKTIDGLFDEIEKGHLRPKKWHGPGILESISYKGSPIQVTELLLARRGFSHRKLSEIQRVMDQREGPPLSFFGIDSARAQYRHSMRQYIAISSRQPRKYNKDQITKQKPKSGHYRADSCINLVPPRSNDSEAFWHAKRAAFEIEKSNQQEQI